MFSVQTHQAQSRIICDYSNLEAALISNFGKPAMNFALINSIENLQRAFPNPEAIKGKIILDLGCGCEYGSLETKSNRGTWAPWNCWAIQLLGGKAVGVDIGYLHEEDSFEFHRIDLTDPNALKGFQDKSFDAVNCNNLFSSSELVYGQIKSRQERAKMLERIRAEIRRLLKKDGIIIAFDDQLDNH
jgi:SAM-dependent methyltransferase